MVTIYVVEVNCSSLIPWGLWWALLSNFVPSLPEGILAQYRCWGCVWIGWSALCLLVVVHIEPLTLGTSPKWQFTCWSLVEFTLKRFLTFLFTLLILEELGALDSELWISKGGSYLETLVKWLRLLENFICVLCVPHSLEEQTFFEGR